jgi:hypothetical protein
VEPPPRYHGHALVSRIIKLPSAAALEDYLVARDPFDEIYVMLFSHGVESIGLTPIEHWRRILQRARSRSSFIGVDEAAYPRDFAVFVRYYFDLQQKIKIATYLHRRQLSSNSTTLSKKTMAAMRSDGSTADFSVTVLTSLPSIHDAGERRQPEPQQNRSRARRILPICRRKSMHAQTIYVS